MVLKKKLKHCASSKTSVKSSRKYFVHLNWIRLATNPSWLDSSIGRVWRQLVDKNFNSSCRAPCSHFSSSSQLRNSTTFKFVAASSELDESCISSMRCAFHTLHIGRMLSPRKVSRKRFSLCMS